MSPFDSNMPLQTDEHLLARARRGDEQAFLLLFERYRDLVFRLAYRLTDAHTAEDITQESFVSLLTKSVHYEPSKGALRTYLYAIVRNLARKHFRLRDGDVELDDEDDDPRLAIEPEAVRLVLQQEMSEMVRQAVASLPFAQREALVLFEYEELSLAEVALVLAVDPGTVKSRLHRARTRLRKLLTPYLQRSTTHAPRRS